MKNDDVIRALYHIRNAIRNGIQPTKPGKAIEAVDLAIVALERDRWISVEERLPEKGESVIVCIRGGRYDQLSWVDTDTYLGNRFRHYSFDERCVAWRPLPEPPKEET